MCRPLRGALFIEGAAEEEAAPILLDRLWSHLELQPHVDWYVLWRHNALKEERILNAGLERFSALLRNGTYGLLVVIFDADFERNGQDACPRTEAPRTAELIRNVNLPIPAAVVLPHKEYEHWFAACLPQWAGRFIIDSKTEQTIGRFVPDTAGAHACLHRRDGKGIIDQHLAAGRYGERTHQPVLTEMLDFA